MGGTVTVVLQGTTSPEQEVAIATTNISQEETNLDYLSRQYLQRGRALYAMGLYESGLNDCRQAVLYDSRNAIAYYLCAKGLQILQKFYEAKQFADRAVALLPSDSEFLALQKEIEAKIANDKELEAASKARSHLSPSLYSWGFGDNGQLGLGSTANKLSPTCVNALRGKAVTDICCGALHSCAIVNEGEVFAFGDNSKGQLGIPHQNSCLIPIIIPRLIGIRIVAISAGAAHTIALAENGKVFGWGVCSGGQLGPFEANCDAFVEPVLLDCMASKRVSSISCGLAHTVFLLSSGSIECCGLNRFGQLGIGSNESTIVPTPTKAIFADEKAREIVHIACGGAHTIVIDSNGCAFSCGSNSCGQLGIGSLSDTFLFAKIELSSAATNDDSLVAFGSCGEEYSILVTRNRALYGFGLNICGQLCLGQSSAASLKSITISEASASSNVPHPTRITAMDNKKIETVSCSQGQVFALSADGEVFTWGLPVDRANLVALSGDVIIDKPEKLTELGKTRRVQQLCCGRKHILCSIFIAVGSHSEIIKGLTKEEDRQTEFDLELVAGQRKVLTIQSRDSGHYPCSQGGALIETAMEYSEIITSQLKARLERLNLKPEIIENALSPKPDIDDNFDGSYNCTVKLYLAGNYRLTMQLNGHEIAGCPVTIRVLSAPVHGPSCGVWWGRFAVPDTAYYEVKDSSSVSGTSKGLVGYGHQLRCAVSTAMSFTVSCRDKYGNKVVDVTGIRITVEVRGAIAAPDEGIVYNSNAFTKGSSGVVPCFCIAPDIAGSYRVCVNVAKDEFSTSEPVEGSPFDLQLSVPHATEPVNTAATVAAMEGSQASGSSTEAMQIDLSVEPKEPSEEVISPELLALHRQEMTRRRALDALRRERAKLALELEEKRRQKAVRRTGGGFIIQYSKDC